MKRDARVVVIGAGIGGLTAAAVLAKRGLDVTVLEAHVDPGGCAGTFFHKGFRFDAGAAVSGGFYPGGPMDLVAEQAGIAGWPTRPTDVAMAVHLPGSDPVIRWTDHCRWEVERRALWGSKGEDFWAWQENTADRMWALALKTPAWPPSDLSDLLRLAATSASWAMSDPLATFSPGLLFDASRAVAAHVQSADPALKLFVDAQLLISAQTTSAHANALYGASALDLPRRGVMHLEGGMAAIADTLVAGIRAHGGRVVYRSEVTRIGQAAESETIVETARGVSYPADLVVANLTPWNIARLMQDTLPRPLRNLPPRTEQGWGAFVVYAGVDSSAFPNGAPLHHQVVVAEPLGEGNSIFVSVSPEWDDSRAPKGKRAVTISTHTALAPWWRLYESDSQAYEGRKEEYLLRLLAGAERIFPGLRASTDLIMPGTPVTCERFTRREGGWVGGFPQTSLFGSLQPRLTPTLWMVGDSVFPGQSTAAVALGGLRVAHEVHRAAHVRLSRQTASRPAIFGHSRA